jgi:hypothetical protein
MTNLLQVYTDYMSDMNSPDSPQEEPKKDSVDFNQLEIELGMSSLDEDAAQMHELFKSLVKAGFRERQALRLVALIITEHDVLDEAIVFQSDIDFDDSDESEIDFDEEE